MKRKNRKGKKRNISKKLILHCRRIGFKKGHIPWNRGLKGIHLSSNSEFKKGQKSLRRIDLPKERLMNLYKNKKLTSKEIAMFFNVSKTCVLNNMKRYGIKRRSSGETNKGKHISPKTEFKKGKHHSPNTEFKKNDIRLLGNKINLGRKQSKELIEKRIKATLKSLLKRPTSLEKRFMKLIEKNNLPFKYVGNGKLIIDGRNPDFVENNGRKVVIEIRNSNICKYLQKITPEQYRKQRIGHFVKNGWKCLVFFEDDLKNEDIVIKKIRSVV